MTDLTRLIHDSGATVLVDVASADGLVGHGFRLAEQQSGKAEGYNALKVADLKAEIERRNEGREGDAVLSTEGKKAELVAVLEADDAAHADDTSDSE